MLEVVQHVVGRAALPDGAVEPQLVPDDAPAQLAAHVVLRVERVARFDPLPPQRVVDVVALEAAVGPGPEPAAVELVAAGLHHGRHLHAARRPLGVRARALHAHLVERLVVPEGRAQAEIVDPVHRVPLRPGAADAVRPRRRILQHHLAAPDVHERAHAGRHRQHAHHAVARRGGELQLIVRQQGAAGRRRDVHDGRRARDGDRLADGGHRELDVDPCREADGQPDLLPADALKSRQVVLDGVGANGQRRQAVLADLVGDGGDLRHLQGRTRGGNGHSRKDCPGLIRHLTNDAGHALCVHRGGSKGPDDADDDNPGEPTQHVRLLGKQARNRRYESCGAPAG